MVSENIADNLVIRQKSLFHQQLRLQAKRPGFFDIRAKGPVGLINSILIVNTYLCYVARQFEAKNILQCQQ